MPLAAGRFSAISGWPRWCRNTSEMVRAAVSAGPPAVNGMTMVTGRDGKSCARPGVQRHSERERRTKSPGAHGPRPAIRLHIMLPIRLYTSHTINAARDMRIQCNRCEALLNPKAIAVVGASQQPGRGTSVVANLRDAGFKGEIFAVNPRYTDVLGFPCYPSVSELPDIGRLHRHCDPGTRSLRRHGAGVRAGHSRRDRAGGGLR